MIKHIKIKSDKIDYDEDINQVHVINEDVAKVLELASDGITRGEDIEITCDEGVIRSTNGEWLSFPLYIHYADLTTYCSTINKNFDKFLILRECFQKLNFPELVLDDNIVKAVSYAGRVYQIGKLSSGELFAYKLLYYILFEMEPYGIYIVDFRDRKVPIKVLSEICNKSQILLMEWTNT